MPDESGFTRRQPKSARSRRELKKKEAKAFENPKTVLFLKGQSCNSDVSAAMSDLFSVLKPHCKRLKKKNAFNAFEGSEHLEFLGFKNDCSLFCFGSHSKKRQNNIILGRHFDFRLLDMVELGIVAMDRLDMGEAKGTSAASLGSKPLFVFEGSEFDADPYFIRLKNLLVDVFRGATAREINPAGVERAIFVSLRSSDGGAVTAPSSDCRGTKPPAIRGNAVVCFRHYGVARGGSLVNAATPKTIGNLRLVDIGPNFDFEIRRTYFAPATDFKRACRLSKEELMELTGQHDNVESDVLGNLKGQLHVGKQDLKQLSTRRFKGSKRTSGDGEAEAEAADEERPRRKRHRDGEEEYTVHPDADI